MIFFGPFIFPYQIGTFSSLPQPLFSEAGSQLPVITSVLLCCSPAWSISLSSTLILAAGPRFTICRIFSPSWMVVCRFFTATNGRISTWLGPSMSVVTLLVAITTVTGAAVAAGRVLARRGCLGLGLVAALALFLVKFRR